MKKALVLQTDFGHCDGADYDRLSRIVNNFTVGKNIV